MAPATPRLRILSVGGNAVSAFLSWRLQATNACDVTLVWKTGYENVAQYGISFKSRVFGNERFKPHSVVKSPEDAPHSSKAPFDYVLLCVKALPDVYDIAAIIETVVSPQHTCILINTTHTLGIESYLEQRFPTNVVLSLVSGAEIAQLGAAEFEHRGETEIYVGAANKNPAIPPTIQADMAEALAMTLSSGEVNCRVSPNIRQQQYDRMIGPIAFHPLSVLFECPNHADLLEKVGVNQMIKDVINELLQVATAQGCSFPGNFREKTIEAMIQPMETPSTMFQDFQAKRPMEIETFLGSPMKLAQEVNVKVPRIETLYAVLHQLNITNQQRPAPPSPTAPAHPPPRLSSAPVPRPPPMTNGSGPPMKNGMRGVSKPMMNGGPPPGGPGPRRGPPPANGFPPRMSSNGYNGPPIDQRNSVEGNDLEEFSHVMLYDNVPDGAYPEGYNDGTAHSSSSDLALRERELALRQRELALREQEYRMRSRQRGPPPPMSAHGGYDDDDDEGDYFDPMAGRGPNAPVIDDNFDMMSITSRRNRKTPSGNSMRGPPMGRKGPFGRPKNRTSARMMADVPGLHDSLMDDPLMGYSSNRYGTVDRHAQHETRANSLTAARLDELSRGASYGGYPQMRRTSASPGNPLSPGPKMGGRPSPPNGFPQPNGMQPNGMQPNGRPSPPGVRQPVPRHPPGHGNAVAPQQVEQHVGVSSLYPPKQSPQVRSLTGSASASARSGDSGASAHLDSSDPSAHSSTSSLGPRHHIRVQ